ncbi:flagellar hook-associated protein FlgK [Modestobacter lapidis]|nr:flagellar hook-associated protein FlgK [Modestobacter lapidis]
MSTFSALNAASTALWAAQRGLDVTGQNVANVNTVGYSRQRAELQSIGGSTVPAIHAVSDGTGGGVSADTVIRIRDAFMEGRAQVEGANSARLTAESEALGQIEMAFREPGTTGIQSMLSEMWSGWSDVVNHPEDLAARSQLLQRSETLVAGLNTTRAALDQQWEQTRAGLDTLVADVNAAIGSIATLNQSITRATQAGLPANELADKRDVLVLQLAEQVGATSTPGPDGSVNVAVGGTTVVSGNSVIKLAVSGTSDPDAATAGDPRIITAPGGTTVRVGGTAEGQANALSDLIPTYRRQLDGVAATLATTLNGAQAGPDPANGELAYDLAGNPGKPLLTTSDGGPVTAKNLQVAITDPVGIAAALLGRDGAGNPSLDGGNADRVYQLRLSTTGVDAQYRENIVGLGVVAGVATRNLEIQGVITNQVEGARDSVAGVSLDEEMTNMLSFQHAYSAAARMITAIDEALDTLINRTGLVGR